jgi:hypothetical protein
METPEHPNKWDQRLSQESIDFGRYFVSHRERQIVIVIGLLSCRERSFTILEPGFGEVLLASGETGCLWRMETSLVGEI